MGESRFAHRDRLASFTNSVDTAGTTYRAFVSSLVLRSSCRQAPPTVPSPPLVRTRSKLLRPISLPSTTMPTQREIVLAVATVVSLSCGLNYLFSYVPSFNRDPPSAYLINFKQGLRSSASVETTSYQYTDQSSGSCREFRGVSIV